mmetsp:Transcript_33129/g.46249  ORF Transcript_33129/g.46249 Transcript_33129/m.46249 type:complete len:300 (-) Transcript_33129:84-983(-)|eukprot:CAMPEP_0185253280 /NCGR_PEP_ID=MMETSP1359-20130426/2103_1 /TAXON_ID=552665 /ORGANISM="Bigelowiella longifila, Strain CCMP242" /LENGTH=299 /DNA_ID=CAMNT_0027835641 /DNA_START=138 /DNA_END=1037 /DNA_ORIENTATION=-
MRYRQITQRSLLKSSPYYSRARKGFSQSNGDGDDSYLHGHEDAVLKSHRVRTAENSAAYIRSYLSPGKKILDVGCGPGTIAADFARLVSPTGFVTAVDNASDVLEIAQKHAQKEGVIENMRFEQESVYRLSYNSKSFDVVHAHQVLQHLSRPVDALKEMKRVCKEQGIVAARDADYAAMFWFPKIPELEKWQALYRKLALEKKGEPDAGRKVYSWAREAGFADITSSSSTWCYATPKTRSWWGGLWAERILDTAIARQALEGKHATQQELEDISEAWKAWAQHPDGWFTVVHGEIICKP